VDNATRRRLRDHDDTMMMMMIVRTEKTDLGRRKVGSGQANVTRYAGRY